MARPLCSLARADGAAASPAAPPSVRHSACIASILRKVDVPDGSASVAWRSASTCVHEMQTRSCWRAARWRTALALRALRATHLVRRVERADVRRPRAVQLRRAESLAALRHQRLEQRAAGRVPGVQQQRGVRGALRVGRARRCG